MIEHLNEKCYGRGEKVQQDVPGKQSSLYAEEVTEAAGGGRGEAGREIGSVETPSCSTDTRQISLPDPVVHFCAACVLAA